LVFKIFGKATAAIEPGEGSLDDPSARQDHKARRGIRSLDDLDLHLRQITSDALRKDRPW